MSPRWVERRRQGSDASDSSASDNNNDQAANGHDPLRRRWERQRLASRGNDRDPIPDRPAAPEPVSPEPSSPAVRVLRLEAFDREFSHNLGLIEPVRSYGASSGTRSPENWVEDTSSRAARLDAFDRNLRRTGPVRSGTASPETRSPSPEIQSGYASSIGDGELHSDYASSIGDRELYPTPNRQVDRSHELHPHELEAALNNFRRERDREHDILAQARNLFDRYQESRQTQEETHQDQTGPQLDEENRSQGSRHYPYRPER